MNEPVDRPADNPYASPASVTPFVQPLHMPLDVAAEMLESLTQTGRNGAAWFYWIAGLSLVNTIVTLCEGGIIFALGLNVMMVSDVLFASVAIKPGGDLRLLAAALLFDAIVLGFLVLCGRLSQRQVLPIYVLGMSLYLLDGLLSLFFFDIVSILIHAYALWSMWRGFAAFRQLKMLKAQLLSASTVSAMGG